MERNNVHFELDFSVTEGGNRKFPKAAAYNALAAQRHPPSPFRAASKAFSVPVIK